MPKRSDAAYGRELARRSETGSVCLREGDFAEMLRGRAFLKYLAADSQNRARRPPRPEMSERKRGNRDQHYGAKKKKTAGTGTQTGKRKPRAQKKRPRGAGATRVPKRGNCERVGASKEGATAGQRGRPRRKKGAGAPLPPSTYRAESGA